MSQRLMSRPLLLRWIAVLAFVGYVATARAVLHLYPFSIFNMYSSERVSTASRIVALEATGAAREVHELTDWDCDSPPDVEPSACPESWPFYYIPYLDREAAAHVAAHAGASDDAVPVVVVRRIFRLSEQPGEPVVEDCVLSRCRAVPR